MNRPLSAISAFTLGIFLLIAGGSTAGATTHTRASATPASAQVAAASWVEWDGNHITTAAKCAARLTYIANTYNIQRSALWCEKVAVPICPPQYYWVLMINTSAAAFSVPETVTREAASSTLVAACA
ncbi:hypothetical protein [Demequina soli]|uniref:hypothetical protein n=1 Tax=Demequina soli TaxID=1638987 RepID=UPI000785FF3E|nr:hypothetical protein [Demequina soli]